MRIRYTWNNENPKNDVKKGNKTRHVCDEKSLSGRCEGLILAEGGRKGVRERGGGRERRKE